MYNDLFSIGPFTVHMYGVMTAVGIICAYFIASHRAKVKRLTQRKSDEIFGLAVFMILFGYLCSKLLYIVTIIPYLMDGSMTPSTAAFSAVFSVVLSTADGAKLISGNTWILPCRLLLLPRAAEESAAFSQAAATDWRRTAAGFTLSFRTLPSRRTTCI